MHQKGTKYRCCPASGRSGRSETNQRLRMKKRRHQSSSLAKWLVGGLVVAAMGALLTFLTGRHDLENSTAPAVATSTPAQTVSLPKKAITFDEAKPILDAHKNALPASLKAGAAAEDEALWSVWTSQHGADIRSRLDRGDVDSLVNLWLYGTSYTTKPRATVAQAKTVRDADSAVELLAGRLDDLVTGFTSPGSNERLQFGRRVLERQGINLSTREGQLRARLFLDSAKTRLFDELEQYEREMEQARAREQSDADPKALATLYSERGLSSDTSVAASYGLDRALDTMKGVGYIGAGHIKRVAIIGPGLDFTDKAEGVDFYPQQSIQPFALIDSLLRLGLSTASDLHLVTLDVSSRVNEHLAAARARAEAGESYVLQLPLPATPPDGGAWLSDFKNYWQQIGTHVGRDVPALPVPPTAADVRLRAVEVRAEVVVSITPVALNIVLERLDPLPPGGGFDLVVATNVLIYYNAFEQALALANVSKMLAPGGMFLTNYLMFPSPPMDTAPTFSSKKLFWDDTGRGDTLHAYRRR
jgi:hypothetical protein